MNLFLFSLILISISPAKVERAVLDHLNNHFPLTSAEYVCDFSRLNLDRVPASDSVEITGYGKEVPRGQVVVFFSFFKEGDRVYKTNGTVRVGVLKEVLTSSVPIKPGEPISKDNVGFEIRDIASENDEPLASIDELLGKVASKYIPSGKILLKSSVRMPPVVSPGDVVNILYKSGSLSLS